jgi:hypothetical protein
MKVFLALTALLAPAIAAPAEAPAEAAYLVSISLRDGNRLVSEPRMTVLANRYGEVGITDKEGNRYDMRFTVSPQGDERVAFRSTVAVVHANGAHHQASPTLVVDTGSTAAFAVQGGGMDRPLSATIQIRPVTQVP